MRSAILVAGGTGSRMGAETPKQFLPLAGKPMLFHAIQAFHGYDPDMQLVVILPKDELRVWEELCRDHHLAVPHTVVPGGAERFHSVRAGLARVEHDGLVAVHDGARPLVDTALIARCMDAAGRSGAAVPVVKVSSSMRRLSGDASEAVDRNMLRMVQTPQCFKAELLRRAFQQHYDPAFTDEATLVERLGTTVQLVDGDERNIKVTTPADMAMAEALLRTA